MSIETMKLALDYLDAPSSKVWAAGTQYKIITALRAAIEQERSEQWWKHEISNAWAEGYEKGRAQREWQGLTDEEIEKIEMSASSKLSAIYLVEAQLKGKNYDKS